MGRSREPLERRRGLKAAVSSRGGVLLLIIVLALGVSGCGKNTSSTNSVQSATPTASAVTNVVFSGGMLTTSNRANLSVCIDAAGGGTIASAEVERVRQAMDDGLASVADLYGDAEQYQQGLETSSGCPPPTGALTATELAERPNGQRHGDLLGDPVRLTDPSQHRVFVYFVPPDLYSLAFSSKPYAKGPAEFLCGGHECAEVTTGLYVTPSVSPSVLSEALLDAIGYLPSAAAGDPPRDRQEVEQQRQDELELSPSGSP